MKAFLILFCLAILPTTPNAQVSSLARQYYQNGECAKAAELYKKLHERNRINGYYFDRYFNVMMDLKRYNEAEVIVKKAIAVAPEKLERYVAYGILLEQQEKWLPLRLNMITPSRCFLQKKGVFYA